MGDGGGGGWGGGMEKKAVSKIKGEKRVKIKSISCSQKICNLSLKQCGSPRTSLLVEPEGLLSGKRLQTRGGKKKSN